MKTTEHHNTKADWMYFIVGIITGILVATLFVSCGSMQQYTWPIQIGLGIPVTPWEHECMDSCVEGYYTILDGKPVEQ